MSALGMAQTVVQVSAADGLNAAIDFANSNPGFADVLELTDDGNTAEYELAPTEILVPLVIRAAAGLATKPVIKAAPGIAQNDYIKVSNDLTMQGVVIDGRTKAGDYAQYKFMFKVNNPPDSNPVNPEPELIVEDCHLMNVYQSGDPATAQDGNFFDISRTSYAAKVHFINTTLENSGDEAIRSINAHKDPVHPNGTAIGSLVIRNCTFVNINGTAVKVESDGDPNSFDGELLIENCTFYKCQRRVIWERDYKGSIFRNLLIVDSKIGNDTFGGTDALISFQRLGSVVSHVDTFNIQGIKANGDTVKLGSRAFVAAGGDWSQTDDILDAGDVEWTTIYEYDPMFADPANGDFTLLSGSPLYRLGHDGGAIGDRRWATNPPPALNVVPVSPTDGLNAAIDFANSNPGFADVLELSVPGGVYELAPTEILVPLVIRGVDPANPAIIKAAPGIAQNDYITVDNDLTMQHVVIDGRTVAGDYAQYKYMFKVNNTPDSNPVNAAPRLRVMDAHLMNVYQSGDPATAQDGNFLDIGRTSWAGSIHFERVTFENSGDEGIRSINAHKDPVHPKHGAFGALIIRDCTFNNINGSAVKIESDGDSLTADAPVLIDHVTFNNCQRRVIWERDFEYTQIRNLIIANSKIGNDTFGGTDVLISFERRGSYVTHVDTFSIQGIKANGDTVVLGPQAFVTSGGTWSGSSDAGEVLTDYIFNNDPQFVDADNGDFRVRKSIMYTLAHDGTLIGDRRWADQSVVGISDDVQTSSIPTGFTLEQNYPNPFNPSTTIRYALPAAGKVKLQIYNVLGALVETLVDENRQAGQYTITWDASNVASGVYFYRLTTDNGLTKIRKMMLLK